MKVLSNIFGKAKRSIYTEDVHGRDIYIQVSEPLDYQYQLARTAPPRRREDDRMRTRGTKRINEDNEGEFDNGVEKTRVTSGT
jgi:hypothetical protein